MISRLTCLTDRMPVCPQSFPAKSTAKYGNPQICSEQTARYQAQTLLPFKSVRRRENSKGIKISQLKVLNVTADQAPAGSWN